MPNLIEVQRTSYEHFLQMDVRAGGAGQRRAAGRSSSRSFRSADFSERAQLEFVRFELETPKYDVDDAELPANALAPRLRVDDLVGSHDIRDDDHLCRVDAHVGHGAACALGDGEDRTGPPRRGDVETARDPTPQRVRNRPHSAHTIRGRSRFGRSGATSCSFL